MGLKGADVMLRKSESLGKRETGSVKGEGNFTDHKMSLELKRTEEEEPDLGNTFQGDPDYVWRRGKK